MSNDVDSSDKNDKGVGSDCLDSLLNLMKIELERYREKSESGFLAVRRTSIQWPEKVVIPEGFSLLVHEVIYLSTATSKCEFATEPKDNLSRGRTKRRIVVSNLIDLDGKRWQLTLDYVPSEDGYLTILTRKRKLGEPPVLVNHGQKTETTRRR